MTRQGSVLSRRKSLLLLRGFARVPVLTSPIMATPSKELQLIPRVKREFTSFIRFIDDAEEPYFETTYLELGRGVVGTGLTREESLQDAEQFVVGLLNDILAHEGKLPTIHQIPIK